MQAIPTIDGHHHIWRLADLAWLSGPQVPRIFGPYAPICRDYPVEEYLTDTQGCNVVKSVYVQTNWPAGRSYDEARWVQSVSDAARSNSGRASSKRPSLARRSPRTLGSR